MPEKKNQHLVPICYLRNFLAAKTDEQRHIENFEQGIFVKNYSVNRGWKLRGLTHNVFTKSYFYNLKSGNDEFPIIENYLGSVESELATHLREIKAGLLSNETLSFLSFYTMLQFMRVDKHLDNMQGTWDQLANTLDQLSSSENQHAKVFEDLAKKQLLDSDFGDIIFGNAHLVYNHTNIPFMTSDSPVVRRQVNICDLENLLPFECLVRTNDESIEERLFFFPLTPDIGFISSPLMNNRKDRRIVIDDIHYIVFLNTATIVNASENVYSSFKPPKQVDLECSKHIQSHHQSSLYAKIYGSKRRVIANLVNWESGRNHIQLFTNEPSDLEPFSKGDEISLCEVIKNGDSIRGMRECNVQSIDHEKGVITIESRFKI